VGEGAAVNRRAVLWVVAAIVGVNALLWLLDYVAPGPSGEPASALSTTSRGFAGWAALARRNGIRVVALREDLRDASLPEDATVVALGGRLRKNEIDALRAHGHAVLGGRRVATLAGARWVSSGPRETRVGGRRLVTAGRGTWAGRGLVVERDGLTLLAEPSPLENGRLARGDNAAFALDLAGSGPLVFFEPQRASGLAALPGNAKGALVLLLVAALVLMLARGKRFGPVEPEARELPPPRVAYVDALAATLARAKQG
jgi:hypothetical protein